MSLLRFGADPFDNMLRLQRALTRSLEQPFFGLGTTPSGRGVYPALNIFEEEGGDAIVFKAEVPGMDKEKLEVEAVGNRLSIAGVREIPSPDGEVRYHRRERQAGEFRRVFKLPYEVDSEKAEASYRDGILTVRLEKAEAAKPRQIQIAG
jgi:HSP20 family protein